jgi:large subunit ribosomal protein L21
MYAVINTGGKQYKVSKGDKIKVEKLEVASGDSFEFDKVLLVANESGVDVGTPLVANYKVKAKLITEARAKKINILKFKRRKHHMKRQGHRQYFSLVEILDIVKQ